MKKSLNGKLFIGKSNLRLSPLIGEFLFFFLLTFSSVLLSGPNEVVPSPLRLIQLGTNNQTIPGGLQLQLNGSTNQTIGSAVSVNAERSLHAVEIEKVIQSFYGDVIKTNSEMRGLLYSNFVTLHILEASNRLHTHKLLIDFDNYNSRILQQREKAFDWNATQSRVIFFAAHLILLVGVIAGVIEFRYAFKHHENAQQFAQAKVKAIEVGESGSKPLSQEEIEIGAGKLAIKTSTRAIWLLLMAFGFYYLYIQFVYPLTELK